MAGREGVKNRRAAGETAHVATVVEQGERIQARIDAKDRKASKKKGPARCRLAPASNPDRFPAQHLKKPGLETDLESAPMYEAPA